jgi:hypothetical protein
VELHGKVEEIALRVVAKRIDDEFKQFYLVGWRGGYIIAIAF